MTQPDYSKTAEELIRFNAMLGLRKRLEGVQYGRLLEYARVCENLDLSEESRLLDLGSGTHSILPWFCAYRTGCEAHITDIGEYVLRQARVARRVPRLREMFEAGRIVIEQEDATALSYPDETFDVVAAISTIEHIPDDGDTKAACEAFRVLKQGGVFAVTVPLNRGGPHEALYGKRKFYLRDYEGEPVFFGHCYDETTLRERIIEAAPFSQSHVEYWHDHDWHNTAWRGRVPFRNFLKHIVGWWLTRKSLQTFALAEQYEGSGAWFGIVILRK